MAANKGKGTLHDALQGMAFPATNEDVIDHAQGRGVDEIQWGNRTLSLRNVLIRFPHVTFTSDMDVENAIAAEEAGTGISSGPII